LLHGKPVFIKTTCNSEDVSLELFAKVISFDFLADSLLEEDSAPVVIIDVERFGRTVGGVGDTELCYHRITFISVTN